VLNDPLIALVAKMDLFDTHATTDVVVIAGAAFRINNFVPFREYPLMLTPFLPNEVSSMDTKDHILQLDNANERVIHDASFDNINYKSALMNFGRRFSRHQSFQPSRHCHMTDL
jgi:hypothetical protein